MSSSEMQTLKKSKMQQLQDQIRELEAQEQREAMVQAARAYEAPHNDKCPGCGRRFEVVPIPLVIDLDNDLQSP